MFDYWNPIKRVDEYSVGRFNWSFSDLGSVDFELNVKSLFEAQEEGRLLNFLHFKSVTLCAGTRSNCNNGVKEVFEIICVTLNIWTPATRIPCIMEHYSKGRNEEEELNSANIPLMGLPNGHGWMLITGGTRFHSQIFGKKSFPMKWTHQHCTL